MFANLFQRRKQLLRIFGPKLIDQLKPREARQAIARSAVFCLAAPATKFWKRDISSASERAFLGGLGGFFVAELPQKRGLLHTRGFARFLSTGVVSASSRALTCPFKQSNPSVWSLLSWFPTHTHLWVRLSVFLKLFVSSVTVPPSDSDYVSLTNSLFPLSLSLSWHMHKYTGGCREQRRGIHGRRGEGARKECCVWGGYFVLSWSVSGAPTPQNYTTIHLGQWSAESGKNLSDIK